MRSKRDAFTLVELMIVVSILGILAALALPTFQGNTTEAKESAAKSNLRAMRAQISLYKLQHNGTLPGYVNGVLQAASVVESQLQGTSAPTGEWSAAKKPAGIYLHGPYLTKLPPNPFNDLATIAYSNDFATDAGTVAGGWLYNNATGEIRLNYAQTDRHGVEYYEY